MRKTKGKNKGITLIALVITIIVLLILAGVSIATLMGENGILTQASGAKEKTEIANIKEQADLVKMGLNIEALSKRNNAEKLKKSVLLSELNDYFEGSTLSGNRITTKDRKYDIIVRNNLDIFVVKRGDDYLKDGEIEISYYYNEEEIEDNLRVELYFDVSGYKSYYDYAEQILENSSEEQIIDMFVKGNNYWNEVWDSGEPIYNNIEELMKYWSETYDPDNQYTTIEEMCEVYGYDNLAEFALDWQCVNPKEYCEKYNYKPYALYAKEILNSIEETGEARETILEQYFIEGQKYFGNTSEEGMEVTDFEEYMKNDYSDFGFTEGEEPTTLDELRIWMNEEWGNSYDTIEEMLIDGEVIKPEEYFETYGEKSLEVTISNGESFTVYYDAFYGELYGEFEVTKNGTYKVTAVGSNGEKGKTTIEINRKLISLEVEDMEVGVNTERELNITRKPRNSMEELIYTTSDKNIATVDNKGKVTGISEGIATITVTGKETTNIKTTCEVTVRLREGLNVGDYINYEPDIVTEGYSKTKLSEAITGSNLNTYDIIQDDIDWQILKIYEDGSMDIIGSPTNQTIQFKCAEGYNNGVYLMNDICKTLYSRGNIEARSVNIEDFESNLTQIGKEKKDTHIKNVFLSLKSKEGNGYINTVNTTNNTVSYVKEKSYYPNIYAEENGSGIDTSTVKINGIKPSEMLKDEQGNSIYDKNTGINAYKQANELTAIKTSYYLDITNNYYGDISRVLITGSVKYWVASRGVDCGSSSVGYGLYNAGSAIETDGMFFSSKASGTTEKRNYCLRPVVHMKSDKKIKVCTGTNSKTNPHTITKY